jgi:hypothetical protein
MIQVPVTDPAAFGMTQHRFRKLRNRVQQQLNDGEQIGLSLSGASASIAVEWLDARGLAYRLTGHPGAGYTVERIPHINEGTDT